MDCSLEYTLNQAVREYSKKPLYNSHWVISIGYGTGACTGTGILISADPSPYYGPYMDSSLEYVKINQAVREQQKGHWIWYS